MENIIGIDNLLDYTKLLDGESIDSNISSNSFIYYQKEPVELFVLDKSKINIRTKIESLQISTCLFSMIQLMTISGKYIPIYDKDTQELLFTEEEFLKQRKKMGGLKSIGADDFVCSENLYFDGLEPYLKLIDDNIKKVEEKRNPIVEKLIQMMNEIGLSASYGFNSGGDVEFIETGSSSRGTNIPQIDDDVKWDFDFTVRFSAPDSDQMWQLFSKINSKLRELGGELLTGSARDKVRLKNVVFPGFDKPIDLDFSLNGQKKDYLSTDDSLKERLENIRMQDERKYRLVLANIMYAKDYLKRQGAYKPNRSLDRNEREQLLGCIGGVGIENWILQNGGSLIDAMDDFLKHASLDKDFIDFEKEYAIMDFGKDHVSVSKGRFPYHNFVTRNMRQKGYENMTSALLQLQKELGIDSEQITK